MHDRPTGPQTVHENGAISIGCNEFSSVDVSFLQEPYGMRLMVGVIFGSPDPLNPQVPVAPGDAG